MCCGLLAEGKATGVPTSFPKMVFALLHKCGHWWIKQKNRKGKNEKLGTSGVSEWKSKFRINTWKPDHKVSNC